MLNLNISKKSKKFLQKQTVLKHLLQITKKISEIRKGIKMSDVTKLQGSDIHYRVTVGEYRIIYHISDKTLYIDTIGKRNDGDIYKTFSRNK